MYQKMLEPPSAPSCPCSSPMTTSLLISSSPCRCGVEPTHCSWRNIWWTDPGLLEKPKCWLRSCVLLPICCLANNAGLITSNDMRFSVNLLAVPIQLLCECISRFIFLCIQVTDAGQLHPMPAVLPEGWPWPSLQFLDLSGHLGPSCRNHEEPLKVAGRRQQKTKEGQREVGASWSCW